MFGLPVAFYSTMQAGCLRDRSWTPQRLDHNASTSLPGERFTADQQCLSSLMTVFFTLSGILSVIILYVGMLRHGRESRRSPQRPLHEICRDLRCTSVPARSVRQIGSRLVSYAAHPALEGTTCGEGKVRLLAIFLTLML